jgi:Major capsid protein N-terminus/Large eukaryotic DNA virus major capsid protein
MTGGLMQLVAYGAQDLYLTGDPQITYFKMVYKRYSNFAMEYIPQYFQTVPTLVTNQTTQVSCKLQRCADLVNDMYLVFDLPPIYAFPGEPFSWIPFIGQFLIYRAEVNIGGQTIDEVYGTWLHVWNELTIPRSKKISQYYKMIGSDRPISIPFPTTIPEGTPPQIAIPSIRLYVPLDFWFTRNSNLALPLIAQQYVDTYIRIEFQQFNNLFTIGSPPISPVQLFNSQFDQLSPFNQSLFTNLSALGYDSNTLLYRYTNGLQGQFFSNSVGPLIPQQNTYLEVNYIFLDTEERGRFARASNEYLIPQTQTRVFTGLQRGPNTINLSDLQHPTKELIWVLQRSDTNLRNEWSNFTINPYGSDVTKLFLSTLSQYAQFQDPNSTFLASPAVQSYLKDVVYQNNQTLDIQSSMNPNAPLNGYNDYQNIMLDAQIRANNHQRQDFKDYVFYGSVIPYKYHSDGPLYPGIYVYPFSLRPEDDSPTGSMNLSRLTNFEIQMEIKDNGQPATQYNLYVFARSFNVYRVMSGIGGLVFTN